MARVSCGAVYDVPVYIYGLTEPESDVVRYVGQTVDLAQRLAAHIAQPSSKRMARWIAELRAVSRRPQVVTFQVVPPGGDANSAEQQFIKIHSGPQLLNVIDGRSRVVKASGQWRALRLWITEHGYTQAGFARALMKFEPTVSVDQTEVSRWLRAKRPPNHAELDAVYRLTGLTSPFTVED